MAMISIFEVVWRDLHGLLPSGGTAKFHRVLSHRRWLCLGMRLVCRVCGSLAFTFVFR
jgi:hypothetical protein